MQSITGRLVYIGNKSLVTKADYQFSQIFFAIKKRMNGKVRNICFEASGRYADDISRMRVGDKVDVGYIINSFLKNEKWYTFLIAKDVYKIDLPKKSNDETQLNLGYDTTKKDFN